MHGGILLLHSELEPFPGAAGGGRGRGAPLVLLTGGSGVYIPGEVPVMPSDLSPGIPCPAPLRAMASDLSALWTLVLSGADILGHYSLLSLDHKSEANTLAILSFSGLRGTAVGTKAMSSAHTQFSSPAKMEAGVGEGGREDWSCSPSAPSWADTPTIYMSTEACGRCHSYGEMQRDTTTVTFTYTHAHTHTPHIQTLILFGWT